MKNFIKKTLVDNRIKRVSKSYKNKIKSILERNTNDWIVLDKYDNYWDLDILKSDNKWEVFYSTVSNIASKKYVPENIYYTIIEPILNKQEHSISYRDKNLYEMLYGRDVFPTTYLRNIDGFFYDINYKPIHEEILKMNFTQYFGESVVIKPTIESGGGTDVEVFFKKDNGFINKSDDALNLEYLDKTFKQNYILQEKCTQHHFFDQFNLESINTIRVLIYRSVISNKLIPLHAILRMGAKGQFVDNSRVGGLSCGINIENECLNNYAVDKFGKKKYEVNGISLTEQNHIPSLEKVINLAKKISARNIHHRLLGLDMFVDSQGEAKCIEINNIGNEINFYQLNNGPLFGEYSEEIKNYVVANLNMLYNRFVF